MFAVFSPHYSFDLPPHHPFPMGKYQAVHDALRADGLLANHQVLAPEAATEEALLRVHTADYVNRILAGELTAAEQRKLGFEWSPALIRRALFATGGTLLAARLALRDGLAVNLAGGSHHAFPTHGEGYCAFHDMAVAIRSVHEEHPGLRIAIVDCDVHQGNGSAAIFGEEPRVFTFSIHCESNYPLRKIPGSRDVGLRNGVEDAEYLHRLDQELDLLWSRFRPQMVFYQAGVDPLAGDRLRRLALSREGLRQRDRRVLARCVTSGIPAVVVLGGGYAARFEDTVEAHAETVRTAFALSRGAGAAAGRGRTIGG